MDSSLEMPQVRSRPEPEAVRPPLPPPSLGRVTPAGARRPDAARGDGQRRAGSRRRPSRR